MTQKGLIVGFSPYPHMQLFGFAKDANWAKFWIWRFEVSWWR